MRFGLSIIYYRDEDVLKLLSDAGFRITAEERSKIICASHYIDIDSIPEFLRMVDIMDDNYLSTIIYNNEYIPIIRIIDHY